MILVSAAGDHWKSVDQLLMSVDGNQLIDTDFHWLFDSY